jgi:death on curing protein
MRYLTLNEVLDLHHYLIEQFGGSEGIRDLGAVESAVAQPRMTVGGEDLYPTIIEKVIAIGFSLINNHPFVDGNKRTGHAVMETFLILNGLAIEAIVDEQEDVILQVASGEMGREAFTNWLRIHVVEKKNG